MAHKVVLFWTVMFLTIAYGECTNCDLALGLRYKGRLEDSQFSASSAKPYCNIEYGRLDYPTRRKAFGVWCPAENDKDPWYEIDFRRMTTVRKIKLGANIDYYRWITSFAISYRYPKGIWYQVRNATTGKAQIYPGIDDIYVRPTIDLGTFITARYFRVYPKSNKGGNFCMQLEMFGCFPEKSCEKPVGIADPELIPNNRFSSSSNRKAHHPYDARLHNKFISIRSGQWGAWCPHEDDPDPWLEIDFTTAREFSNISTLGHPYKFLEAWTTEYKLNFSTDGQFWHSVVFGTENFTIFEGNTDFSTVSIVDFNNTFVGRYVRFIPVSGHELACVRLEMYECVARNEAIPKIVKKLNDVTIKRGEELLLECVLEGQPEIQLAWHQNGAFFTMDERIGDTYNQNAANATALLHFQRVTSKDNGTFSCLAWYPGLGPGGSGSDIYAKSTSAITVLAPTAQMKVTNISANFVVVRLSFIGPLTKDVKGFVVKIHLLNSLPSKISIPVDVKSLNSTRILLHKLTDLRPYSSYTFSAAIWFEADELGDFTPQENIFTKQDVPYGPPLSLQVVRIESRTLGASWSFPNATLRNGPIIAFQVRYIKSVEEGESEVPLYRMLNDTSSFLTIKLRNLEAGSIYRISVRAFTKVGPGPFIHPAHMIFTGKATAELNKINNMKITKDNAAAVSTRLKNITSDRKYLNKHDVELSIDILEKVVDVENSTDIGESLVNTVSNVLRANKTVLEESEMTNRTGTRYVKVLEKWLEGVDTKEKDLEEDSQNVVVKKVYIHKDRIEEEIKFAEEAAEISVPTKVIPKNKSEDVALYFVYYKKNKFFPKPTVVDTLCVDGFTVTRERTYSQIIAGDVVGSDMSNLSQPVELKFRAEDNVTLEESACVYWDFEANDGKGNWSSEGCSVIKVVGRTITCHCNHMTNYAAMMDIYAHTSKICGHDQIIISYITVIGSFLSLIGLFITFLTYTMFRNLQKELSAKVLVQLCVSLFVVVLTFIVGIEQVDRPVVCTSVAISLHYFTLVSFFWMMIEAVLMYHSVVRVWPPQEGGDIRKASLVAWGIPFIVVMVTYLTNRGSYSGRHYCHVIGIPLYAAYLAPMGLVILTNFALFLCIMYGLSTRPDSNTNESQMKGALIRCRRAFGIMILMGLTWSFGFGLASKARLQFSYLFAVANGLQGFAIFVFYCVAQTNARNAWKRFFTCDRRSKGEKNSDSFHERNRLSSAASTRTQHTRNSDASTLLRNNHRASGRVGCFSGANGSPDMIAENTLIPLNPSGMFIALTPPQSPKMRLPRVANLIPAEAESLLPDEDRVFADEVAPAEDELLNMKLQKEEDSEGNQKAKMDLKKYSSYRALSGPTSFDVFSLVKTPSAVNLHKNAPFRKSAEFINRKSLEKNRLNRSSMIESSSLSSSQYRHRMRSAKSMEAVNRRRYFDQPCDANANNISLIDLKKQCNDNNDETKDVENVTDDSTVVSNDEEKEVGTDSDTLGPTQQTYVVNVGTMKSDATTMTDPQELDPNGLLQTPLYGCHGDSHRSPDAIMQWLQEGDQPGKCDGTDSDYSSTFYKTSRSSSMTEIHGPLRSSASECTRPSVKQKPREKEVLDSMVLVPLKGTQTRKPSHPTNPNRSKKRRRRRYPSNNHHKTDSEEDGDSELSEGGYSASEEDIVDNDGNAVARPKSRRRKTRRRSTNLSSKVNQYVSLDQPTQHVSFV